MGPPPFDSIFSPLLNMFAPARSPITKQRSTKIKQGNFRKFISAQNKGISMAFFGPGRSIRLTNYYRLYWNSVITFSVKKWYQNRYRNWISVGINGHLSGEIRRPFGALGFYATYGAVMVWWSIEIELKWYKSVFSGLNWRKSPSDHGLMELKKRVDSW